MAFSQEQIINLPPEPFSPILSSPPSLSFYRAQNVATHLPRNYIFNNCVSTRLSGRSITCAIAFRLAFARLERAPPISSDPACRRGGLPLPGKSRRSRQCCARALLCPRLQLTMSLL